MIEGAQVLLEEVAVCDLHGEALVDLGLGELEVGEPGLHEFKGLNDRRGKGLRSL